MAGIHDIDWYAKLGIARDASMEEIKKVFESKRRELYSNITTNVDSDGRPAQHTDLDGLQEDLKSSGDKNPVYQMLTDESQRAAYHKAKGWDMDWQKKKNSPIPPPPPGPAGSSLPTTAEERKNTEQKNARAKTDECLQRAYEADKKAFDAKQYEVPHIAPGASVMVYFFIELLRTKKKDYDDFDTWHKNNADKYKPDPADMIKVSSNASLGQQLAEFKEKYPDAEFDHVVNPDGSVGIGLQMPDPDGPEDRRALGLHDGDDPNLDSTAKEAIGLGKELDDSMRAGAGLRIGMSPG